MILLVSPAMTRFSICLCGMSLSRALNIHHSGTNPQALKQSSTSLRAVFIQSSSGLHVFGVLQSDPEILCLVHFAGHCSALLLAPDPKNGGQDGARRGPRAVSVTRLTVLAMAASSLDTAASTASRVMTEPRSDFLFTGETLRPEPKSQVDTNKLLSSK